MRPPWSSRPWILCGLLAAAVAAVYLPVRTFDFVNFDDPDYVLDVPLLRGGISWELVGWTVAHAHARLWHPLTTLSHALDWQLWGASPGGHHLTSVVFHAADAVLLFVVLRSLTGATGRSLAVALLWGLHPLRVESVAWVAERKDVLSGVGFLLTIAAYRGYVARPTARRYLPLLLAFSASLLAKSTVVTLPVILLLLDEWPLRRTTPFGARLRALLPLAALAAATSAVTIAVQRAGGAVASLESIPLEARLANAVVAVVRYLLATVWPTRLAVFYPYRTWSWPIVLGAVSILLTISVLAWRARRTHPYVLVGWGWWLLALLPVIGVVQAGAQSMADRFTYLPAMGLTLALVWGAADLLAQRSTGAGAGAAVTAALVAVAVLLTRRQLATWRSSETLFQHALAVTERNHVAHNNLGLVIAEHGDPSGAAAHYAEAVRINPSYSPAQLNLGNALLRDGRLDEAEAHLRAAIARDPALPAAHNSLGVLLAQRGRFDEATGEFERVLSIEPGYAEAEGNLADALRRLGRLDAAAEHLRRAAALRPDWVDVRIALGETLLGLGDAAGAGAALEAALRRDPASAAAHFALANALFRQGRTADAVPEYQAALRLRPDWADAHGNLGVGLMAEGDAAAAVPEFEAAVRLAPENPQARYHLGLALVATGRRDEGTAALREALRLRPGWPDATRALAEAEAATP